MATYMIGQRVIYGNVVVTLCKPENNSHLHPAGDSVWIDNPVKGYKHCVSRTNLKPLPNGQV